MPSNFAMSKSQFTDYMEEKKFYREDYPLDILGEFGLTEEMIYDLPDFVHETIERGGKSPLLPISIEQPFGVTRGYAKFSLVDTEEGIDVVFYPRFKQANLAVFGEEQKNALMEGKVIVADINDTFITQEGVEDTQRIKAFVQLDKDTRLSEAVKLPSPLALTFSQTQVSLSSPVRHPSGRIPSGAQCPNIPSAMTVVGSTKTAGYLTCLRKTSPKTSWMLLNVWPNRMA